MATLPHEQEPLLAGIDPVPLPLVVQVGLLLLPAGELAAAPLGDGGGRLELDREPGGGPQLQVAAPRHPLLVVPEADQGAGAVALVADGVAVDRAVQARP